MAEQQPTPQLKSLVESAQEALSAGSRQPTFELPYAAPDLRPNPAVEPFDKVRSYLFGASSVLLLCTSLAFSFGLDGRSRQNLLDPSLVQSILWPAIAIALILSAAFSLRRDQRSARRQRKVAISATAAVALMACAITLASSFLTAGSAVLATISALLALYCVHQLNQHTARTKFERWATDAPLGFFAGFSMVYALQLWFATAGWTGREHAMQVTLVAVGVSLIAAGFAHTERGRHALASGFGISMVAAAIQGWFHESTPLWVSAVWIFMALLVFLLAENRRFQISHAEHRAQRGKPIEF